MVLRKGERRPGARAVILAAGILLAGCSREIAISAVTVSPQAEAITFNVEDDVRVVPGSLLLVSIQESFASYEWALDGVPLAGQVSSAVGVDSTPLSIGAHHLVAFVQKGGHLYSKRLRFVVGY